MVCVESDTSDGSAITISVSGGSLTWTNRVERDLGDAGANSGHASIWTAPVGTGASMTVSVRRTTTGGGTNRISAKVYLVTGQHASPIGAVGEGSSTTNDITPTVFTSTGENSYGFGAACDWSANGIPVSSDLTEDGADYSLAISVVDGFKDLGASGAESMNFDAFDVAAATWNWAALEILAAAAADTLFAQGVC